MSYNETMVQEYTELLEGCHMGAGTFQIYLDETSDLELRSILKDALSTFKHHEEALTKKIVQLGSDPSDEVPLMGMISELIEKMKVKMADTNQTLDYALRAIEMGIKAIESFHQKYDHLHQEIKQATSDLLEDYKLIYRQLSDYKLERMPSI